MLWLSCEPEPEFRLFGAEADDVPEGGGRVVGLGLMMLACERHPPCLCTKKRRRRALLHPHTPADPPFF